MFESFQKAIFIQSPIGSDIVFGKSHLTVKSFERVKPPFSLTPMLGDGAWPELFDILLYA